MKSVVAGDKTGISKRLVGKEGKLLYCQLMKYNENLLKILKSKRCQNTF